MKYKLINSKTNEEHLCDKVVVDGWDYYVSDEKLKVKDKFYFEVDGVSDILEVESEFHLERISGHLENKKVIATNNPNIDIPKVVDEVNEIKKNLYFYKQVMNPYETGGQSYTAYEKGFIEGYNQSQETHPFSEEDMIEFDRWKSNLISTKKENYSLYMLPTDSSKWLTTKELLQLWKEQQPKTVYYE